MRKTHRELPILTGNQLPNAMPALLSTHKGQLYLENQSGTYWRSTESGRGVRWERVSFSGGSSVDPDFVNSVNEQLAVKADSSTVPHRVIVVTGDEVRPSTDFVIWVGGSTAPINMVNGDIWYSIASTPPVEEEPTPIQGNTVFGTQNLNSEPGTWNTDGENLWAMNGFATLEPNGIDITGVRFWMPDTGDMDVDVSIKVFRTPYTGTMITAQNVFAAEQVATGSKTTTHQAGWNEVVLSQTVHADPLNTNWWDTTGGSFIGVAIQFGTGINYVSHNWDGTWKDSIDNPGTMLMTAERGGGGYSGFGSYSNGNWFYGLDIIFEVP